MTGRLLICCHATGIGTTIATVRSLSRPPSIPMRSGINGSPSLPNEYYNERYFKGQVNGAHLDYQGSEPTRASFAIS
jgi:hypothetical protein